MTSLICQLKEGWKNNANIKSILGRHGALSDEETKTPLGLLNQQQATHYMLTWITWQLKPGEITTIRVFEPNERTAYVIEVIHKIKKGLKIKRITNEPTLVGKVLHHWDNIVTYDTLSVFQIKASTECADTLNSFNDNVLQEKINELINEAIQLELPNDCMCDVCQFVSEM